MDNERERWGSRASFIMASIGSAIGLGNVWRFPYVCYKNGGGAFLIPYFVALITAGIPLMILEYGLGRRMQSGAPSAFAAIRKGTEWVGWLALFAIMLIFFYYPVIMAWCVDYVFYSIKLSWGTSAQSFFYNQVLERTAGPGVLGGIRWPVIIGLAVVWGFMYLCLFKGVKVLGKIVMYTVIIPWAILVIMVVRGLTLPGALGGLNFYLTPNFSALLEPGVWLAAYGQVFFTLSLAMGIMIVYSSYLSRRSDITNNAYITCLANCGTSFFAGFAVFSTLGYLAQAMGVGVPEVTESGLGLAFITYPTAIRLLPFWAPFFGVLFFILLLTLGVDSAFSQVEPFVAGFVDKWGFPKKWVLPLVCIFGFLVGTLFTTRGGIYWLDIVDYFVCTFGLTLVGFLECIAIGYIYKCHKMREYVNEVSEFRIGKWWDVMIMIVTPAILGVSFVWELIKLIQKGYGDYPRWTSFVGVGILALIIILSLVLMRIKGKEEESGVVPL
jgi:NSS family neurotransmitter:Na+ symporter